MFLQFDGGRSIQHDPMETEIGFFVLDSNYLLEFYLAPPDLELIFY